MAKHTQKNDALGMFGSTKPVNIKKQPTKETPKKAVVVEEVEKKEPAPKPVKAEEKAPEKKVDIKLLFRKFASDFAEKYRIPAVQLTPEALAMFENYRWDGNIRQLKNVTEQISIIEKERVITPEILSNYLPAQTALPAIFKDESKSDSISERDILYKVLFDMKKDITELRKTVDELTSGQNITPIKATVINHVDNPNLVDYETTQDAEVEYLHRWSGSTAVWW